MYSMKRILEPEIIDILNKDRFEGDVEGYVLSDGGDLFGWILFRIDGKVTYLLDALAPRNVFLDGLIRAGAAYGEHCGAESFSLNGDIPRMKEYHDIFFRDEGEIISNDLLFAPCEDE